MNMLLVTGIILGILVGFAEAAGICLTDRNYTEHSCLQFVVITEWILMFATMFAKNLTLQGRLIFLSYIITRFFVYSLCMVFIWRKSYI